MPTHTLERARSPGSRERSENEGFRSGSRQAARTGRGVAAEAYGVAKKVQHLKEEPKDFDDATLADKIRSQVFRHADLPKGKLNVNVQNGVVQLRGEVPRPDLIEHLVAETRGSWRA